MSSPALSTSEPNGSVSAKVRRDNRLGWALIVTGALILVACNVVGFFHLGSSGPGNEWFVLDVMGSGGIALVFAGAVFFGESRTSLRRKQRTA